MTALTWKQSPMTIEQFYAHLSAISTSRIDCDPVGQRPDVESLSKSQGIIDTVIQGYDFGELKLRTLPEALRQATNFKYRSIDGGHRKRAVRNFIEGRFKTGKDTVTTINGVTYKLANMYYKELPEVVREQFNRYPLRFTVYDDNMTDEQAGETFRRTNITTDVNHQEMLNSYEDNLVAKFVREISRPIAGLDNEYHPLFVYTSLIPGDRKQAWFKDVSTRLRDDEWVTRILTFFYKLDNNASNWMSSTNKELENTFIDLNKKWADDPQLAKRQQSKVIEALDFILSYGKAKKKGSKYGFVKQDFNLIMRLYFYLVNTYGTKGFKVKDFDLLYVQVRKAMDRFVGTDETNLRTETHKDDKGLRLVCECFKQYLTVHDDEKRAQQSIKWLLEEMKLEHSGVVLLDPVRVFPQDMIEEQWRKNNGICEIDGLPLDLNDAVGAHIIAHSEGGKTNRDNLMVCRKEHNDKMGSMNALDYKRVFDATSGKGDLPVLGDTIEL